MTAGSSGAMSRIWRKIDTARGASPSPSTCSPIAISGSISACGAVAFGADLELAEQLVERALQLRFGAVIGEVGDRLALVDRIDRRDRLDAELRGDQLVLVDVDLDEVDALGGIFRGDLFERERKLLARRRTVRPEIENDQRGHRRMDDLALEPLDRLAFGFAQAQGRHGCRRSFKCLPGGPYGRVKGPRTSGLAGRVGAMLGARLTSAGSARLRPALARERA